MTPRVYLGDVIFQMHSTAAVTDDDSAAARGGGGGGGGGGASGGGGGGSGGDEKRTPPATSRAVLVDGVDAVPLVGRLDILDGGALPVQMLPDGGGARPLARVARRSVSRLVAAMKFWK